MPRRNKRRKSDYRRMDYRRRLPSNPDKYITDAPTEAEQAKRSIKTYRGEVWYAYLGAYDNSAVVRGCRPVVIISNERIHARSGMLTVIPMTSSIKKSEYATHVQISDGDVRVAANQTMVESLLLVEQMRIIDKTVLNNRVGKVTAAKMKEIEDAVRVQLGLT